MQMNTLRHRTIVVMLTVIAVLLALNLMVTTAPASPDIASATANANGPPVPTIVKLLPVKQSEYLRVWSDGRVDDMNTSGPNCDFVLSLANGPVEHPFPVVDAIFTKTLAPAVMLTYGDGRVDLVGGLERCTIAGVGTPSFCTGDVDRDGTVGIQDFLALLAQWGQSCQ